jgi:hypothetical protein
MGALWSVRDDVTYFGEGKSYYSFRDYYAVNTKIAVYQLTTINQKPEEWSNDVYRLWMIRNIYDVVSSMIKLNWVQVGLAGSEIRDCLPRLSMRARRWANDVVSRFEWDGKDSHRIAAFVYLLKHSFHDQHKRMCFVKYENLVSSPESELKRVCEFVGVNFEPVMLEHHTKLSGELHGTKFNRSIDRSSIGKSTLTDRQRGEIDALTFAAASVLGSVPEDL